MVTQGKRRAFGQHFLKDSGLARQIARTALEEAKRHGCTSLLEIGPGRGAITRPLLEELRSGASDATGRIDDFVICERDEALAQLWKDLTRATPGHPPQPGPTISVEEADFMDLPEDAWLRQPPLAVVSNLPYSAGTAIFTRLAALPDRIPVMVLMFQAEVAQRLYAEPDTRDWGRLSIWTQNVWDVKKILDVPKTAFNPPPQVESEVVVVTRREQPRIPAALTGKGVELWEPMLKTFFTHRRKMLRSGLPRSGPWRELLIRSGIDETLRPEALGWPDWERLVAALS